MQSADGWLRQRSEMVTASDVAAIMALSPYEGPADVWRRKVLGEEKPRNERMLWGSRLQSAILAGFAEDAHFRVREWPAYEVAAHEKHPWFGATPDAQYAEPVLASAWFPAEAKNVAEHNAREWKTAPPLICQVQLAAQMAVLDAPRGILCALIGGQRLVWHVVERDAAFERVMLEKCASFWKHVMDKEPIPEGWTA